MMICRICSVKYQIPIRDLTPEVGICPVCLEAHALYPVKREQAPEASPWVLVGERLPEPGELVLITAQFPAFVQLGWITRGGRWILKSGARLVGAWMWCPIPPLPEIDG